MTRMSAGAELARFYDLDMTDAADDLDLYLALAARTGGRVLELAVGSGRVAVRLALADHPVVGLDIDRDMLARASARWDRERGRRPPDALRLVEGDLRTTRLDERFALVILAVNSLLLLPDRDAQAEAVRTMAAHLEPGGLAVIDVTIPSVNDLGAYDGRAIVEWVRDDPESGDMVSKTVSARYDPATSRLDLLQLFDTWSTPAGPLRRVARHDRLLLIGADQLTHLARSAGLEVEQAGGDLELSAFGPGSDRLVLVSRLV
jgi:SAM-dependent methyltransferase